MCTWKLVACETEGISHDLLVDAAPDLEKDLADGHPRRPMIERTLTLTHTHLPKVSRYPNWNSGINAYLITADVDADVAALPLV